MEKQDKWLSEAIGGILASRRRELGLTQEDIAQDMRIQRTSLSNIESGKQVLLLDVFYRLCKKLGLSPAKVLDEATESEQELEEIEKVIQRSDDSKIR